MFSPSKPGFHVTEAGVSLHIQWVQCRRMYVDVQSVSKGKESS